MIFYISKLAYWLLMPISWILVLLAWAFLTKKELQKKRILAIVIGLFVLLSNPWLANTCMKKFEYSMQNIDTLPHKKIAVLLTGVTKRIEWADGRIFYGHGADRVLHTLDLYQRKKIDLILISGGFGALTPSKNEVAESQKIATSLLKMGVDSSDILIENKSRNTYENALYTKKILDSLHYTQDVFLVTSAFHLRRAKACFDHQKIKNTAVSTDFYAKQTSAELTDFVPSESALSIWGIIIHELIGLISYKILGYI